MISNDSLSPTTPHVLYSKRTRDRFRGNKTETGVFLNLLSSGEYHPQSGLRKVLLYKVLQVQQISGSKVLPLGTKAEKKRD